MISRLSIRIVVIVCLLLSAPVYGDTVLDQQHSFTASISNSTNGDVSQMGQTFTVGVAGTLVRIDVLMFRLGFSDPTGDPVLRIYSVAGGLPTGVPIATVSAPKASVPFNVATMVQFDLSSAALAVTPGDVLAFSVSAASGIGPYFLLTDQGQTSLEYAGGEGVAKFGGNPWQFFNNPQDHGFRTWVETPSQPAATLQASRYYHGGWSGAGTPQWNAMDTGKTLIVPGESAITATYGNLINTSRGINGVVLDISDLGDPNAATWEYRMSPSGAFDEEVNPSSSWEAAPAPSSITTFPGIGVNGSDRVLVQWADNAIANRWLRVRVTIDSQTLTVYAGPLLGETTGPVDDVLTVAFADITPIRSAVGASVDSSSIVDIDKNGTVAFADISAMRNSVGAQLTNITVPAAP